MRRQGYEFLVSKPKIITKVVDGKLCEPMERLVVDAPEEYVGTVIESTNLRKGDFLSITPTQSYSRIEFMVPSRGLIGYRSEMMTKTKGTAVINSIFEGYEPMRGEIQERTRGSLVAFETGKSVTYGLYNAQDRGVLFIGPNVNVYEGMIVGENSRDGDMAVNVCKKKHVTNMRASGSDEALRLTPPKTLSLEQCLEFIADDELLEVTPNFLRLRKKFLSKEERMKYEAHKKAEGKK
jgi:GTP-binding protein